MKLNAVGVATSNLKNTVEFYTLLGFKFPEIKDGEDHLESITAEGGTKLMIDSKKLIGELIGAEPVPGNTSPFALQYDTPQEIDAIVEKIKEEGLKIVKEPWDAFWGQRYAVVSDPDGYMVDLYASLS
jgi:catechol 2,3-dioxygenase-like lactoylglutathione lyase family enzyme